MLEGYRQFPESVGGDVRGIGRLLVLQGKEKGFLLSNHNFPELSNLQG